ncbi:hypothetical protein WOLCODRAFT_152077 [Wolfiporia cocos MD-104 SS10]|uniref:Uncharacterized protein n=1 Tax=Wolfiporia cocos (strain MD-104) TaxID=742152 RepID=A0A2H3JIL7_WOLCO|nr:hypothetical protein WOLCODRAFT_152077 [Wolfiporia cocos MD-104 SS10]
MLNDDASNEGRKQEGTGTGHRAGMDEHVGTVERRLHALQGATDTSAAALVDDGGEPPAWDESDGESDMEPVHKTDQERQCVVLDAVGQEDLQSRKTVQTDFSADFMFPTASALMSMHLDELEAGEYDVQVPSNAGSTVAAGPSLSQANFKPLGIVPFPIIKSTPEAGTRYHS